MNDRSPSPESPLGDARILVLAPNALGDAVMATPMLRALAHATTCGTIDLVARLVAATVLANEPWLGDVFIARKPPYVGARGAWRLRGELRKRRYDIGVSCPNSLRAALLLKSAGVRRRLGYARELRGSLLSDALPWRGYTAYTAATFASLLEPLGLECDPTALRLTIADEARAVAAELLNAVPGKAGTPVVGLNVGAAFGPSKVWPAAHWAAVADAMLAEGARVIVHSAPNEAEQLRAVLAAMRAPERVRHFGDAPLSLEHLPAVIAGLRVLVTSDTGPRHLAVAAGVPVVTLSGAVDARLGTSPAERGALLEQVQPCAPCNAKTCRFGHTACMRDLAPARVIESVRALLAIAPDDAPLSTAGLTPPERYVQLA